MPQQSVKMFLPVGQHLMVEFIQCTRFDITRLGMLRVVEAAGATPLEYLEHEFKPEGKSVVMLLEESHISIHTYPEHAYIAADIYTCGLNQKPYRAVEMLRSLFNPRSIKILEVMRGPE